jgi:hypothetical protein
MTTVPAVAAILAGFVLAHAAWSISDLPNGDGFVPLAVVVVNGERQLQRFAASTPDEAVAKGRAAMKAAMSSAEAWAFAYNPVTVMARPDVACDPRRVLVERHGRTCDADPEVSADDCRDEVQDHR